MKILIYKSIEPSPHDVRQIIQLLVFVLKKKIKVLLIYMNYTIFFMSTNARSPSMSLLYYSKTDMALKLLLNL
jgi:hypothetical protein